MAYAGDVEFVASEESGACVLKEFRAAADSEMQSLENEESDVNEAKESTMA